jgi:hypothetical protein
VHGVYGLVDEAAKVETYSFVFVPTGRGDCRSTTTDDIGLDDGDDWHFLGTVRPTDAADLHILYQ